MSAPLFQHIQLLKKWFRIRLHPSAEVNSIHFLRKPFIAFTLKLLSIAVILQCISGLLLSSNFIPSGAPIVNNNGIVQSYAIANSSVVDPEGDIIANSGQPYLYNSQGNGIRPSLSFYSLDFIIKASLIGKSLHFFHKANTHLIIALCLIIPLLAVYHSFVQTEFAFLWHIWWLMTVILMGIAWTGYILPWTQFSSASYSIVTSFLTHQADWLGGAYLASTLGKGSVDKISKLYNLHSLILPSALFFVVYILRNIAQPLYSIRINKALWGICILLAITVSYIGNYFIGVSVPSDSIIPQLEAFNPEWFFLPFHGIINVLPEDAAFMIILASIIGVSIVPYFNSRFKQIMMITFVFIIMILASL